MTSPYTEQTSHVTSHHCELRLILRKRQARASPRFSTRFRAFPLARESGLTRCAPTRGAVDLGRGSIGRGSIGRARAACVCGRARRALTVARRRLRTGPTRLDRRADGVLCSLAATTRGECGDGVPMGENSPGELVCCELTNSFLRSLHEPLELVQTRTRPPISRREQPRQCQRHLCVRPRRQHGTQDPDVAL